MPDDFELMHYASEYYDPAKAREYYLKNRKLKGRRSSAGMSDKQRQGWDYTKNQVSEGKKQQSKAMDAENKQSMSKAKANAKAGRERIKAALAEFAKKISEEIVGKARAIPEMPEGLSSKQKTEWNAKQKKALADISTSSKASSVAASAKAQKEVEAVRNQLKSALASARTKYKSGKSALDKSTESTLQKEYDGIKKNLPGKPAKAPKKPKKP